jgi:hypothetical protein
MGINHVRIYKDGIYRDFNIISKDRPVYASNGQGCDTVWYESVPKARKIKKLWNGVAPNGHMAGLCNQCGCHYSIRDPEHDKYPQHACKEWKEKVANGEITEPDPSYYPWLAVQVLERQIYKRSLP